MSCFCFLKDYRQRNTKFVEYTLRKHKIRTMAITKIIRPLTKNT